MKIYWEEDEFRYWEFMHAKALDAADRDTAFALGFLDIQRQDLRCAERFSSVFRTRKGLRSLLRKYRLWG